MPFYLKKEEEEVEEQEHVIYPQASHGILISYYLRTFYMWDKIKAFLFDCFQQELYPFTH